MPKVIDIKDFRGPVAAGTTVRFATVSAPTIDAATRTASFVFSDESVDRYGDVISARGWDLSNFNKNPIALFGHDAGSVGNVVGKAKNVRVEGPRLVGDIEFMDGATNPNAEAVFQMVKGGWLNTVSVGFLPLDWEASKERKGGVDFKRQELLEISIVPIPANPNAVALAKAAGVDVARLGLQDRPEASGFATEDDLANECVKAARRGVRAASKADWTCAAARDLPVDKREDWDGPGAEKRIFEAYGFDGDKPDSEKARRAFLLFDASNPTEKGSYKEPFADLVGGKLTVTAGGVRAAASRLPDTDVPDEAKAHARTVLDHYEARLKPAEAKTLRQIHDLAIAKSLDHVAMLCGLVEYADRCVSRVEAEALDEGDGSPNPARLREWVNEGCRCVEALASEEAGEKIGGTEGSEWRGLPAMIRSAVDSVLSSAGLTRGGKAISARNEKHLRTAAKHCESAGKHIMTVLEPPDDENPESGEGEQDPTDDAEERALRERKAKARAARAKL